MATRGTINSESGLSKLLKRVTCAPSCIDLDWEFEIKEIETAEEYYGDDFIIGDDKYDHILAGWLIRTTFKRPDTNTGEVSRGHGRWEYIERGSSKDSAIKTCWLLMELIVRHELMEAFLVDGKRIFNPHKSIEDLKDD